MVSTLIINSVNQSLTGTVKNTDKKNNCLQQYGSYKTENEGTKIRQKVVEKPFRFELYPNPALADNKAVILSSEEGEFTLYDVLGRAISKQTIKKGYNYIATPSYFGLYNVVFEYQDNQIHKTKLIIRE